VTIGPSGLPVERIELVRRTYDAFNRRDIDTVLAALAPDVAWPNVLDGVTIHGHAEVRAYWERQFATIDPRVDPVGFRVEGDRLAVTVHQVIRDPEGNVLTEGDVVHTYAFEGDLVTSMEVSAAA